MGILGTLPLIIGVFCYQTDFDYKGTRISESVYSPSVEGKARLSELRQDGFTCEQKLNQIFLCKKNVKMDLGQTKSFELLKSHDNECAEIYTPHRKAVLNLDSETGEDWTLFQKLNFLGKTYDQFRLRRIKRNEQIIMERMESFDNDDSWTLLKEGDHLLHPVEAKEKLGRQTLVHDFNLKLTTEM